MTGQETSNSLLFDRVFEQIKLNKSLREEGKHICIPSPFKRFGEEYPGIQKATYYLVTGNQKAGKTQISDFMFIYNPINFILENDTNIKLKIFDFNLEMSKEKKIKQAIVHKLFVDYGVTLSVRELDSIYNDRILPDRLVEHVEKFREWFAKFESIVTFIDDIRNGYGIYKYIRGFFEENGHYEYKKAIISEEGTPREITTIDRYIPNDPDLFVIILIDNINLLIPEKGQTLFESIGKFSSDYMVRVRNRWFGIPVIIQQQALSKEGNDSIKIDRTEPSADGLADNKATSKDCDILLTIYSPFRNRKQTYLQYDITKLKDNYRRLAIEFDRNGQACETSLFFNGAVNYFSELPKAEEMTDEIYKQLK